jgi:hypothetical protein
MSDETQELFKDYLNDLKADLRQLDAKFDKMHEVLVENSSILKEHERRSTASEKRLDIVEKKLDGIETKNQRVKGFFLYTGFIASAVAGFVAALYYLLEIIRK